MFIHTAGRLRQDAVSWGFSSFLIWASSLWWLSSKNRIPRDGDGSDRFLKARTWKLARYLLQLVSPKGPVLKAWSPGWSYWKLLWTFKRWSLSWWLTSVILATWEAEIRRIKV
jgi:hypothetical protein